MQLRDENSLPRITAKRLAPRLLARHYSTMWGQYRHSMERKRLHGQYSPSESNWQQRQSGCRKRMWMQRLWEHRLWIQPRDHGLTGGREHLRGFALNWGTRHRQHRLFAVLGLLRCPLQSKPQNWPMQSRITRRGVLLSLKTHACSYFAKISLTYRIGGIGG